MLATLKQFAKRTVPPLESALLRRQYAEELAAGEPELRLLPALVDRSRPAVDVGANVGAYAFHLSRLTSVVAFEPNPGYARTLRRGLPAHARIEAAALSDHEGEAVLSVPRSSTGTEDGGCSTLEQREAATVAASHRVPTRRLDSYRLDPGFIKIDVEGHEEAVVNGALETIRRARPVLLIECEERHRPGVTTRLPALLAAEGYTGWFYVAGQPRPIAEFNPDLHQPQGVFTWEGAFNRGECAYYNNFLFMPDGTAPPSSIPRPCSPQG